MFLDTWNKNMYGLGVGISLVFEILGHFLFKDVWDHPAWSWPTYHQMLLDKTNNIYGLGVGVSKVFEIFSNFLFLGLTSGVISNVLHILPVPHCICFWRVYVNTFDSYMKKYWNWILLNIFLSNLELSKMTLRYLGPQAIVSRNICYQQHQFLKRGLGDMSLADGWTDGHNGDSMLPRNFFREHENKFWTVNMADGFMYTIFRLTFNVIIFLGIAFYDDSPISYLFFKKKKSTNIQVGVKMFLLHILIFILLIFFLYMN
jgi:hypothetical protein